MSDFKNAFVTNSLWSSNIDHSNNLDYFFTQRKIIETKEYVDEKTMERKEKQETITHNFLAINFPDGKDNTKIDVELWGDNGFNYKGCIINEKGNIPNLLLKLNKDTQIFVKLIYNHENDKKTYIHFISINKRYQTI
jgi:hypothetical protein